VLAWRTNGPRRTRDRGESPSSSTSFERADPKALCDNVTFNNLVALQDRAAALDAEIYRGRETIEAERRAATAELRDLVQRRGQTGVS